MGYTVNCGQPNVERAVCLNLIKYKAPKKMKSVSHVRVARVVLKRSFDLDTRSKFNTGIQGETFHVRVDWCFKTKRTRTLRA